jgi:hypothetical protein
MTSWTWQESVDAFLADHRHQPSPPELFADLVRQGGASVGARCGDRHGMVLQALEGLSDREAVSALLQQAPTDEPPRP